MRGALVRDIMPDHMVTISESDTLSTVEDIMTLGRVRHMPVVHGGKLVGVVSERDLLRASLSNLSGIDDGRRRAFLHGVEIARVMSSPPVVVHPDETVEAAARVMAIPFLGRIPLRLSIRKASDAGTPPAAGEGEEAEIFRDVARRLLEQVKSPAL